MPIFPANPQRLDPYKNFKFRVKWDGRFIPEICRVSPLLRSTQVVSERSGGDPSTARKQPGATNYEAITLERGLTQDHSFEDWANLVWKYGAASGSEEDIRNMRKDVTIDLLNEAGQLVYSYIIHRCWPSEYAALPQLDTDADGDAVEHIVLQNEGWERDNSVTEPTEP